MPTIKMFVRQYKSETTYIRYRISVRRDVLLYYTSDIAIKPEWWDDKRQRLKSKIPIDPNTKRSLELRLDKVNAAINDVVCNLENIETSKQFAFAVDSILHPKARSSRNFFECYMKFVDEHSLKTREHHMGDYNLLLRFEQYKGIENNAPFALSYDSFNIDTLEELSDFIDNEYKLCDHKDYKCIYADLKRKPKQRGNNTKVAIMKRIRAFSMWSRQKKYATIDPFEGYQMKPELYGTPIYLTIEERNKIRDYDLSARPRLAIQRDIFIFHCLIGCRITDLYSMTSSNIIDGAIEYIAEKTKGKEPQTVRVPLSDDARSIIERYKGHRRLLPFIAEQSYNDAIKVLLKECGINRIVTHINPKTGETEQVPIYKVASSHMARRTFIGNLYKKVKNADLVSSLSGHSEGSKAFYRYRQIDDEMKQEMIILLE